MCLDAAPAVDVKLQAGEIVANAAGLAGVTICCPNSRIRLRGGWLLHAAVSESRVLGTEGMEGRDDDEVARYEFGEYAPSITKCARSLRRETIGW